MQEVRNIEDRIQLLKDQLKNVKGTETEVYTRIVGYYRSVKNWNNGKRAEFHKRSHYSLDSVKKQTLETVEV